MTINKLIEESYKIAREKGWWDEERCDSVIRDLVYGEVAEWMEEERDGRGRNEIYYED